MSWFASLLTRQKEPSQGSGSQGLFIELSGLHGCRRGMCQRENASLIKARSEMQSYFCQTLSRDEGLEENNSLHQRLHVYCSIVRPPALKPTQSPAHLHRLLDFTEHRPVLASFSFSTPASKQILSSGCLKYIRGGCLESECASHGGRCVPTQYYVGFTMKLCVYVCVGVHEEVQKRKQNLFLGEFLGSNMDVMVCPLVNFSPASTSEELETNTELLSRTGCGDMFVQWSVNIMRHICKRTVQDASTPLFGLRRGGEGGMEVR